jgi:hypothetical protein
MYTATYEHPIGFQTGETVYVDAVEPHDRNQDDLGMHIVRGAVVYDRAGRIPYDDVC